MSVPEEVVGGESEVEKAAVVASAKVESKSKKLLSVTFQTRDVDGAEKELGVGDTVKLSLILVKGSNKVIARNVVLLKAAPVVRLTGTVMRELIVNSGRKGDKQRNNIGKVKTADDKLFTFAATDVSSAGIETGTFRYGSVVEFQSK